MQCLPRSTVLVRTWQGAPRDWAPTCCKGRSPARCCQGESIENCDDADSPEGSPAAGTCPNTSTDASPSLVPKVVHNEDAPRLVKPPAAFLLLVRSDGLWLEKIRLLRQSCATAPVLCPHPMRQIHLIKDMICTHLHAVQADGFHSNKLPRPMV